ncbi:SDR family NAD(P)-dependent oxidoreductase [Candidatus Bathyarchaeota archaeon]|nr:SDR family NAD(P)-dependent oxidoreductase [Candidatus Bathyarchaeota archaeon]
MLRNNRATPKKCTDDFNDKLVVITGATSGIGYCTAREYASHGANIICINRNEEKSKNVCEEIRRDFEVKCDYKVADFTQISDVKRAGRELLESKLNIDVLIHNAGVHSTKKILTNDDNELVFQVIYLGSFILNYMLKDRLRAQERARIIFVNSEGYRFAISGLKLDDLKWKKRRYTGLGSYGAAKTAQLLSMIEFNEYFIDSGVTINACHPGQVKTNIGENNGRFYRFYKHHFVNRSSKSPQVSADALYYLGVSKDVEGVGGKFFNLTTEEELAPHALDKEVAEELWKESLRLVGLE